MIAAVLTLGIAQTQSEKPKMLFEEHHVKDKFDRDITFYVSPGPDDKKLPLALLILGSGGQSIWNVRDGRVMGGLQNLLYNQVKDHMRVVIVEKPGVPFGFQPPRPGTAEGCPREFLKEHTLDKWAEANSAVVTACGTISGIDNSHVLAIGHSEGGIVIAKVAAINSKVTHLAVLSGGGPNQLIDLEEIIGPKVKEEWKKIQADPESFDKFAWGHPYLRWSSFLKTSTTEELLKSKAQIFIAAGTEDHSSPYSGFKRACEDLKRAGREFTAVTIEGGDHGFGKPEDQGKPDGFIRMFAKIDEWYFSFCRA